MKLIDLHKKWCEEKYLTNHGLCGSVPGKYRLDLLVITPNSTERLENVGHRHFFWGSRVDEHISFYTPLRQTIVLLICAMNNEL